MSPTPDWGRGRRGAKTAAVMAVVESAPMGQTRFGVIKKVTGLETRTLISILYSLQTQGRVAPLSEADQGIERDDLVYARVDHKTVFPCPIVRVCPYKPRRRRALGRSGIAPPNRSAGPPSPTEGSNLAPSWLMPRMPPGGAKSIGVPQVRHSLVTAGDLEDDLV